MCPACKAFLCVRADAWESANFHVVCILFPPGLDHGPVQWAVKGETHN